MADDAATALLIGTSRSAPAPNTTRSAVLRSMAGISSVRDRSAKVLESAREANAVCRYSSRASSEKKPGGMSRSARASMSGIEPRPRMALLPKRSEEHTSELQSLAYLVCRLLLEKKKKKKSKNTMYTADHMRRRLRLRCVTDSAS